MQRDADSDEEVSPDSDSHTGLPFLLGLASALQSLFLFTGCLVKQAHRNHVSKGRIRNDMIESIFDQIPLYQFLPLNLPTNATSVCLDRRPLCASTQHNTREPKKNLNASAPQ